MTSQSGLSGDGQVESIQTILGGGFELALLPQGHSVSYTDDVTTVTNAAAVIETVPEADATINTPADFSGSATLELTADVEYLAVDEGVLEDFAVLGSTGWILGEEIPSTPDTTGEDVVVPSGETLYESGNI